MRKSKREAKQEDSRLVKQAQADKEAFGNLYRKYFKSVTLYLARRLGRSYESAEDLAQETFLRAFRRLSSFRSRGYSYLTYLLRISHNLLVNVYRRRREERLPEFADKLLGEENDLQEEVDRVLLADFVGKALRKLPPKDQELLSLFYEEELSVKEIAKRKKKTQNAVKLQLSRARKRLAKVLALMTPFPSSGVRKGRKVAEKKPN